MEKIDCKNCRTENNINNKYCSNCGYALPVNDRRDFNENVPVQKKAPKTNSTNLLKTIISVIAVGLVSMAVQHFFFKPPSLDKELMAAANEISKACPIIVDQDIRLDNAIALPDNSFQYNFSLINYHASELNVDTLRKYIEPGIINRVKSMPELKPFRDNKTTMIYSYSDKVGVFVFKIAVKPDMYE